MGERAEDQKCEVRSYNICKQLFAVVWHYQEVKNVAETGFLLIYKMQKSGLYVRSLYEVVMLSYTVVGDWSALWTVTW